MTATGSGNLTPRQHHFEDYLQRIPAEQEEYAEVGAPRKMAEADSTNANKQRERLLEEILGTENLNRAYKQVKRNKGAGEIDGMQAKTRFTNTKTPGSKRRTGMDVGQYKKGVKYPFQKHIEIQG